MSHRGQDAPQHRDGPEGWDGVDAAAPTTVVVSGVTLRRGSRVRLRPRNGADIFDLALCDQTAVVDSVEQDLEGRIQLAVTLDADPGRDLSARIGQRFFFGVDEVEPLGEGAAFPPRVLVAGIGNVFLGDDGFGVEVVRRLRELSLPDGVQVVDFGIRGMDLLYALGDGYHAVVLVDAAPRGEVPGTVSLVEPVLDEQSGELDAHGMDPLTVLRRARRDGALPDRILLVACEPANRMRGDEPDIVMELSAPVRAAVDEAARLIEELLGTLTDASKEEAERPVR